MATIYYVRPTNGSDAAAGTTFGTAFQTTQKAVDTAAVAGDVIRLCPEAAEVITAKIDFDTNAGTVSNYIVIEPGNTTDGSRDISLFYTINTSTAIIALFEFAANGDYYEINNVILDANATATYALYNNADSPDNIVFKNCRFTDATSHNISVRGQAFWRYFNCETDNAGGQGIKAIFSNRGLYKWFGGSSHDNASDGFTIDDGDTVIQGAEIYGNGGNGVTGGTGAYGVTFVDNTVYNNTGDGFIFFNGLIRNQHQFFGNTLSSNGGYGINFQGLTTGIVLLMDYNHTYNNTSGASDQTLPGDNNQTGDPLFTSVGAGTEDFIPTSASPLNRNNLMGRTIGARQSADPAGGGGGMLVNPKMSGGMS